MSLWTIDKSQENMVKNLEAKVYSMVKFEVIHSRVKLHELEVMSQRSKDLRSGVKGQDQKSKTKGSNVIDPETVVKDLGSVVKRQRLKIRGLNQILFKLVLVHAILHRHQVHIIFESRGR